ncbi:hypothetical protein B0T19DRAFT_397573 [Cercophora scortea]|uniref:Zn(2)-C6 fungal-type domain-containing protein n=1 Tax=Cercophora scortea TaxID=314031 RepID=A0AAE0MI03_9PEZI|nr:hypothetical protein B0T19DRAFT_397573 [Cercophora scortea]
MTACDWCHAQKLSCQRQGNDTCARCARAEKPCITSPSLRNKGRSQSGAGVEQRLSKGSRAKRHERAASITARSESSTQPSTLQTESYDGPFFDHEDLHLPGNGPEPANFQPPSTPTSTAPIKRTSPETDAPQQRGEEELEDQEPVRGTSVHDRDMGLAHGEYTWVSKLAELNVQLHIQTKRALAARRLRARPKEVGKTQAGGASTFDDALGLFFQLMRILTEISGPVRAAAAPPTSPPLYPDHHMHRTRRGDSLATAAAAAAEDAPDHGSMYLILSCYIRVLQMCTDLLGVYRVGTSSASTASSSIFALLPLPSVVVGALPLNAYPALRLRVALEFLEGALDHLRVLLAPVVQPLQFIFITVVVVHIFGIVEGGGFHYETSGPGAGAGAEGFPSLQGLHAQEEAVYELIRVLREDLGRERRAYI